jgi:hypothetical protein
MRLPIILAAVATLAAALPVTAAPHYIVDTGLGTDARNAPYLYGIGAYTYQWVAIQFFVPTATTITSIEGALTPRVANTTLTAKLYTVGATTDAPDIELFAQAFTIPDGVGFHGATGFAFTVAPGAYYAAFEVLADQDFNGFDLASAPNPQAKEAAARNGSGGYHRITNQPTNDLGSLGLSLRVGDSPATVPEPAAWSLLIAGFAFTGAALRRRALTFVEGS